MLKKIFLTISLVLGTQFPLDSYMFIIFYLTHLCPSLKNVDFKIKRDNGKNLVANLMLKL